MRVRELRVATRQDASPFIIDMHYAGRWPSVSSCWALWVNGVIEGVVTYGRPPSSPLRTGLAGHDLSDKVWELNRLCLRSNHKNDASWLVSRSLSQLGDAIVVSFADASQGHVGYVYQACGFTYTGLSAKRTDWLVRGMEHKHGITIADEFRGMSGRASLMREKYGDDFILVDRPRKHRYVKVVGSRSFVKKARREVRYGSMPYPKGNDHE